MYERSSSRSATATDQPTNQPNVCGTQIYNFFIRLFFFFLIFSLFLKSLCLRVCENITKISRKIHRHHKVQPGKARKCIGQVLIHDVANISYLYAEKKKTIFFYLFPKLPYCMHIRQNILETSVM